MPTAKPFETVHGTRTATSLYADLVREGSISSFIFSWDATKNPEWRRLTGVLRRLAAAEGRTVRQDTVYRGSGRRRRGASHDGRITLVR